MAASPSPNTSQRVEYVPSEQEKMRFELGYGAKNAPGRIALREASRIGSILEGYNKGTPGAAEKFFGYSPTLQDYKNIVTNQPNYLRKFEQYEPKEAAKGGLMSLRGYADGGSAEKVVPDYIKEAVAAQEAKNKYPVAGTGTYTPPPTPQWIQDAVNADAAKKAAAASTPKGPAYSIADALTGYTAGYDPTQKEFAGMTNPYAQQALTEITNLQTPAEYKAATELYGQLASGLQSKAGFAPSQVSAGSASAQQGSAGTASASSGSAQQAKAQQMAAVADVTAPELQYFQADRGGIRDVTPSEAEAYGYDAAEMQAAQMDRAAVRDINAQLADVERYNASLMNAPADIQAQAYRAAQAQGNQMDMPSSWTEAGTAEKYMNPYIQNVVDIEKREALRDYEKQLNALNSQAVGAKAYGGSRLAIERSEAARNQAMKMADIEAKGLNEAYQQGIGQFAIEQGQGLQAGQANLTAAQQTELANQQALNSQRSQYVTQALQAAQNNYGGKLTAAQQNQIAQNAAAQFNAQSQNTAYNNYVAQQLAAQQANQQMDFGVGQLNTQNQQQAYAANQVAQNAANQFYAQAQNQNAQFNSAQALAAQQLNQGMDAQTVMANLQANLGVDAAQAGLIMQGALANQQTAYNTGALNANLGTNVSLQNAQLGTQASLQNAQLATQASLANAANQTQISGLNAQLGTQASLANQKAALDAQIANQSAGLTANQQGIGALIGAMGAGSGMLQSGGAQTDFATNKINLLGQAATTTNQLQQNYLNQQQQNAQNTVFGTNQAVNPAMNMLQQTGVATGSTNTNTAVR